MDNYSLVINALDVAAVTLTFLSKRVGFLLELSAPVLLSMSDAVPLHLPVMEALFWSLFPFIYFSYADSAHYFLGCCVRTAGASEASLVSFIGIDVKQMHRQHKPTAATEQDD